MCFLFSLIIKMVPCVCENDVTLFKKSPSLNHVIFIHAQAQEDYMCDN